MPHSREKEALSAYFKLLEKIGAKSGQLYQRSLLLDKLIPLLANKPLERASYGAAIEQLNKSLSAESRLDYLHIAREFYPFWIQDIKAIAAFSAQGGFDLKPLLWEPQPKTLPQLTQLLKTAKFSIGETRNLMAYTQALRDKQVDHQVLTSHLDLAKILLIQLKDSPKDDARVYRKVVDFTLGLFKHHETKQVFLSVAREFYTHWLDQPYTKKPSKAA